jgi:hypothetical protein
MLSADTEPSGCCCRNPVRPGNHVEKQEKDEGNCERNKVTGGSRLIDPAAQVASLLRTYKNGIAFSRASSRQDITFSPTIHIRGSYCAQLAGVRFLLQSRSNRLVQENVLRIRRSFRASSNTNFVLGPRRAKALYAANAIGSLSSARAALR